ncbi:hypothetical protein HDU91_004453, partial [Kappamyces sp. JEL0680]
VSHEIPGPLAVDEYIPTMDLKPLDEQEAAPELPGDQIIVLADATSLRISIKMENSEPVIIVNETFAPDEEVLVEGTITFANTNHARQRRGSMLPVRKHDVKLGSALHKIESLQASHIPVAANRRDIQTRVRHLIELPIPTVSVPEVSPKTAPADRPGHAKPPETKMPSLMLTNKGLFSQGIRAAF